MNKQSTVSGQPLAVEEQGTTMRLYHPIVEYGESHRQAMMKLTSAVMRGDQAAAKQYFDQVIYFEQMQRAAAIEARRHSLEKARSHE